MKKIILLIATILFFATFTTNAQIISYSQTKITKVKKEKKPRAGYFQQSAEMLFGGSSTVFETGANYIAGYRFNDRVFLGGGVGFSHTDIDGKEYDHYDCFSLLQARLFLNAKFYLTKTRAQPFFDLSLGGCAYWDRDDSWSDYEWGQFGLSAHPQFGVNYKLNEKISLYASIGYQLYTAYGGDHYPSLKLGITF